MRILHICQRDDPDIGGSLRVAEALVDEQLVSGIDAWILFLYGPPACLSKAYEGRIICLELASSREALKGLFKLKRSIQKINPDIIHTHAGLLWPRLVYVQLRTPVVMHAHLPAASRGHRTPMFLIKKTTDAIISISSSTSNSWIKAGFSEEKIHFIPNGVDSSRFTVASSEEKHDLRERFGLPDEKRILLWLGRVQRSMKGADRVGKIARLLPEDTILLVVGNGPDYQGLRDLLADLIDQGDVVLAGSTTTACDYYRLADVFLFTSHHEPFGLVILEAAVSGLPIIAYPLEGGGGAVQLLDEMGACRIDDDAGNEEVQAAIIKAESCSSSVLATREKLVEKYSWSSKSSDVEQVYKRLLGISTPESDFKVLVCQHGARHRYAIPRMLNRRGVLGGLYTDSSSMSFIGGVVKVLGERSPKAWKNLARWDMSGIPKDMIRSSDLAYFYELSRVILPGKKEGIELFHQRHQILASRMIKWGLSGAKMVYSMYHEDLDFIRWAKCQGALSVIDVFINPETDHIMAEEFKLYPDWAERLDTNSFEFERGLWRETVELADLLICPSEWVADGVRNISPAASEKVVVVPYGCSIDYDGRVNSPVQGRILFAGNDPLRKGLHYLGEAATKLKPLFPELDIRVAGNISGEVVSHPICKDLNFIGQLNRSQMEKEYLSADALVLPALSEGFAGVVAEAIGAGCPVIVTKEAGSPIIHEREGLIVPSRTAEALADAIQRMVTDRDFRSTCADNCLKQVAFYSESHWQGRLFEALETFWEGQIGTMQS